MTRATQSQLDSISQIFARGNLEKDQQRVLLRALVGHDNVNDLTETQATIVLSSAIARGTHGLAQWADSLVRPERSE